MSIGRAVRLLVFAAVLAAIPRISTAQQNLTVNGISPPDAQTVTAYSTLTVQVSRSSGTTTDWVSLSVFGAPTTSYVSWKYLSGTTTAPSSPVLSGSVTIQVPAAIGAYEVRLHSNNGYTRLATSGVIVTQWPSSTVSVGGQLPPQSTLVYPGATVNVTVANGTGVRYDWIGLSEPGTPTPQYLAWNYLSGTHTLPSTGVTSATVPFTMPQVAGLYEFRFFSSTNGFDGNLIGTSTVAVAEQPVTVNGETGPSPLQTTPGAALTVDVTNGPANRNDWVGLYRVGSPSTQGWLEWKYLNGSTTAPAAGTPSATLTFTMPSTPGNYELRSFANGGYAPMGRSRVVSPDLGHWRIQGTDCYFDRGGSSTADECQPNVPPPPTYPSASYTLAENRERLLTAWRNRVHPGMELCELWATMSDSEQLIFLTITHRLSLYRIRRPTFNPYPRSNFMHNLIPNYPEGDDLLSHVVDLFAIRPKDPGSLGGMEYNRLFMKVDGTAYLALALANLGYGRQVLAGTGAAADDYWLFSDDIMGAHSPFSASSMTHGEEGRGQIHMFRPYFVTPPLARACATGGCPAPQQIDPWTPWGDAGRAYEAIGRPGVEDIVDPYAVEMDQDFGFWHDSDVTDLRYAFRTAFHWGDFTPNWRPTGCAACSYEVSPQSAFIDFLGGTVTVAVNTSPSYAVCKWKSQRNPNHYFSWIQQQSPSINSAQPGTGTIEFSVQYNSLHFTRSIGHRVETLDRYWELQHVSHDVYDDIPAIVIQGASP